MAERQLTGRPVARGKVLDDREPHRLPQRGVNLSPMDQFGSHRSDAIDQIRLSQLLLKQIPRRAALGPVLLDASGLPTRLRRVVAQPGKFGNHVGPTNVYKGRMASD